MADFLNLANVLAPLYSLLKKEGQFNWSNQCEDAYREVKQVIASDKVLAHYDTKLPVKLVCDASQNGIGAAIFHVMGREDDRPIAFASKTLSICQRNYSTIDREALAIYFGVKKFEQYLFGRSFTLQTDHKPLVAIFGDKRGVPTMAASRLQRWAEYLSAFDYRIQYITGESNVNADFLSRLAVEPKKDENIHELKVISYLNFIDDNASTVVDRKSIRRETENDKVMCDAIGYVKTVWPSKNKIDNELMCYFNRMNELTIEQNILMWGHRVVIPSVLRKSVLSELHMAHSGIVKMKAKARAYFWWPGMDRDIEMLAKSCMQCVSNRPEQAKAQPIPWPQTDRPFQRIHIDHLGPFRNKTVLIVKDNYSKWIEAFIVSSLSSTETINKLRECFARFGLCETIISDNGRSFASAEFREFCNKNGVVHLTSAPFHPQSNGEAENAVKLFKSGLNRALDDPKNHTTPFETLMQRFLFEYRSSIHTVTKQTPFKMMFGRDMALRLERMRPKTSTISEAGQTAGNTNAKSFSPGESVLIRNYARDGPKWIPAKVVAAKGSTMYDCISSRGQCVRHVNQMMKNSGAKCVVILNDLTQNDFSCNFRAGNTPVSNIQAADPIRSDNQGSVAPANIKAGSITTRRTSERPRKEIKRIEYTHGGVQF